MKEEKLGALCHCETKENLLRERKGRSRRSSKEFRVACVPTARARWQGSWHLFPKVKELDCEAAGDSVHISITGTVCLLLTPGKHIRSHFLQNWLQWEKYSRARFYVI